MRYADCATCLCPPTRDGPSVGIVRSRTKATELLFLLLLFAILHKLLGEFNMGSHFPCLNCICHPVRGRPRSADSKFLQHALRASGGNIWASRRWSELHNEELHDLYSSPSIIRIIKLRRLRWAGRVARIGRKWFCWER
jgi:hypothetical protein